MRPQRVVSPRKSFDVARARVAVASDVHARPNDVNYSIIAGASVSLPLPLYLNAISRSLENSVREIYYSQARVRQCDTNNN